MKKHTRHLLSRVLWSLVAISGLLLLIFTIAEKHCDTDGNCTRAIPLSAGIPISIFMLWVSLSYLTGLLTKITDFILFVLNFVLTAMDPNSLTR